ncbi:MAG: peptidylprolyl isomerase [Desulfuromonadales bacterium]|nr:peptidylprolyl isomerase [Desulfuromonadales bacterium]MDW7758878.1 peptidylprolyl isomerase [Desulfuromonadales bacterium]
MMKRAHSGDRVAIHYIGTLDNGRIFDSTTDREPLSFVLGAGEVFAALEEAVAGMAAGEAKNLLIPAEKAYGPHRKENLLTLRENQLPAGSQPRPGQQVELTLKNGDLLPMRVIQVQEGRITLDGNHPLAGLDLTFALKVDSIS